MNKISVIKTLLFTGILILQCYSAINIWRPRMAHPEFIQPGGIFYVEVKGPAGLSSAEWSAEISNDLKSWTCTIQSVSYTNVNRDTEDGYIIEVGVPEETPPELFDLSISHASEGESLKKLAVSVLLDLEEDFYILHMTDEHLQWENPYSPSWGEPEETGYRSADLITWAAPAVNLINPRFVICTGDNTHVIAESPDPFDDWQLRRYIEIKEQLYKVPLIVIPGNHDVIPTGYHSTQVQEWEQVRAASIPAWEELMGQRSFSIRIGSFYILGHDFGDESLMNWALEDLNSSFGDAAITYRLIGQHHPSYFGIRQGNILDENYPDMVLGGHEHPQTVIHTSPYYSLLSASSDTYARATLHEFQKTAEGWDCTTMDSHMEQYFGLVGDWGAEKISVTYSWANDGTLEENSASIVNDISQNFPNGRIRFLMQKGNYEVTGGEILAEYDYDNDEKTAVLVKVNIEANNTSEVSLVKTVTAVDGSPITAQGAGMLPFIDYKTGQLRVFHKDLDKYNLDISSIKAKQYVASDVNLGKNQIYSINLKPGVYVIHMRNMYRESIHRQLVVVH
jgi:3',5'-cyclic AMP phosphodiesterase CpdA